jgi:hypothetical protein
MVLISQLALPLGCFGLLLCEIEGEIKRAVLLAADAYLLARALLWENTARERKAGAFLIVFECCDQLGDCCSNI